MEPISPIFLILSLFLPRITLLGAFLFWSIPANTVPIWGDILLGIFLPRVLILIYIYENMGPNHWFWIHLAVALFVYLYSGRKVSKRRR